MSLLSGVIQRGTAAAQPAATTVPVGTIYFQTDTFFVQRSNGTTWDTFSAVLLVGDSGAGGTRGLVPAPAAGDAAANKFLKADGTWQTAGAGKLIQVVNTQTSAVQTGSTTIPFDDTIPQNTEGNQVMTLAITPTSATNKLKIEVTVFVTADSGTPWLIAALFQDSTANALAADALFTSTATAGGTITFTHYMTSGTTSSTTFKVRVGCSAGNITFNGQSTARRFGGVIVSSITISEIVP